MFTTKFQYVKYEEEEHSKDCHERMRGLDNEYMPQLMITKKRTTENPIVYPRKLDVIPISSMSLRFLLLHRAVSPVMSIRNSFNVNMGKRKHANKFFIHVHTELNAAGLLEQIQKRNEIARWDVNATEDERRAFTVPQFQSYNEYTDEEYLMP